MIPRPISLIVCLIGGYFLGSTLTWLYPSGPNVEILRLGGDGAPL